ncbi:serine hydrolase domain-containing protein [Desulforhopalus singaporensis]|uniref:CubicO group peptidase, beta-lactamase class C family n=1 Tax=Desulforhopalus singaporensis TaxID=91360 RepID=A0A1H0VAJ5_9BACT|nr:serine hydrolase domain-containing protein [Desulforhopalus singaporensis]SDP75391.1 CubicO group peptidase, beta-lactamase class C family [Desulforhopalus singaporensis]
MENQVLEELQAALEKELEKSLSEEVFSGCSLGFFDLANNRDFRKIIHLGTIDLSTNALTVADNSCYDLASLTKPLVTSLCVLALHQEKKLDINDTISSVFGELTDSKGSVTIFQLLNHTAGLPAHRPYYEKLFELPVEKREGALLSQLFNERLVNKPGQVTLYSDIGYMLLGKIVEKVSRQSLDRYWRRKIIAPLGLEKELFFGATTGLDTRLCVVTGKCEWSGKKLRGEVHDDNCRAMGGVAGHAGLFGTAGGVVSLCRYLLKMYHGRFSHPSVSTALFKESVDTLVGTRRCGFDIPTGRCSSSGHFFSPLTIGHLGFTGTSFWIDLADCCGVVFLTNRVISGDDQVPIKKLRPVIHDIIVERIKNLR